VRSAYASSSSYDLIKCLRSYIPQTDARIFRVHIRTLSNDDPHPLAQQTPLQFTVASNGYSNKITNVHLEIARDTLLVHFYTANMFGDPKEPRVLVWDWPTSELILPVSRFLSRMFTYLSLITLGFR
jgi:hypothetical protein